MAKITKGTATATEKRIAKEILEIAQEIAQEILEIAQEILEIAQPVYNPR